MIIRGEFRSNASTTGKEEEMIQVEHSRERIGIIKEGLAVLMGGGNGIRIRRLGLLQCRLG